MFRHEKNEKKILGLFWLSVIWVYLESCEAVSSAASVAMFSYSDILWLHGVDDAL